MKAISLVFAPFAAPFMPPLGLPLLSAFLSHHGLESEIQDLNIELYNYFLEDNMFQSALEAIMERYRVLKNKLSLDTAEASEYMEILPVALMRKQLQRDLDASLQLYHRRRKIDSRQDLFHSSQIIAYALRAVALSLGHLSPHPRNPYLLIEPQDYQEILTWTTWRPLVEWYTDRLRAAARVASIVGFSVCYPAQLPMTLLGAYLLRKVAPNVRIVMGGPFSTSMIKQVSHNVPKGFLGDQADLLDAVIIEDGEFPLLEYIEALQNGRTPEHPAIVPSSKLGVPLDTKRSTSPPPPSLLPAFRKMPIGLYLAPRLTLPMLTSRHCYWGKCTFCAHSIGYSSYHRYEAEDVLRQLLSIEREFGTVSIYFMDECVPPRNALEIARGLRDAKSSLRWAADMRFEQSLDRSMLQELYGGGCRYIAFGLESVNERVNKLMRKGTTKSTMTQIINDCYDVGIHSCLMFFCGFPTETREEALETVNFALDHVNKVSAIGMSYFTLCPGTELYEHASEYGIYDIQKDGEFCIDVGMNREEGRKFRTDAGEMFGSLIYEGHELYHRLFYTFEIADLKIQDSDPYPLRVTELSKLKDSWRKFCLSNGGKPTLWADMGIDSCPFDIDSYKNGQGLERRDDSFHSIVIFNVDHPLGRICSMQPRMWSILSRETVFQQWLTKPEMKTLFVDEGIVYYE